MRNIWLTIAVALTLPLMTACAPARFSGESNAANPQFTEPTFVSMQPVAYPHPTGCEMCGFPMRLGSPQQ